MKVCRLLLILIFSCSAMCSVAMMQKSPPSGYCHKESKPVQKGSINPCCDQPALSSARSQLSHSSFVALVMTVLETPETSEQSAIFAGTPWTLRTFNHPRLHPPWIYRIYPISSNRLNERSAIMVRTMFSLEPLTIDNQQYPLLFQTGETAHGRPIADGQHPHDLFMELSLQYVLELAPKTLLRLYFAPVGDPALGPVAYPHRISATKLRQATLSHHLQDSTHIVFDVPTAGIQYDKFRLEVSGFHGREPDEDRWDIEGGAIDSWSSRLTVNPSSNWSGTDFLRPAT